MPSSTNEIVKKLAKNEVIVFRILAQRYSTMKYTTSHSDEPAQYFKDAIRIPGHSWMTMHVYAIARSMTSAWPHTNFLLFQKYQTGWSICPSTMMTAGWDGKWLWSKMNEMDCWTLHYLYCGGVCGGAFCKFDLKITHFGRASQTLKKCARSILQFDNRMPRNHTDCFIGPRDGPVFSKQEPCLQQNACPHFFQVIQN